MTKQEIKEAVTAKLGNKAKEEAVYEGLEWALEAPSGQTLSLRWLPSKPDLLVLNDPASPVIAEIEETLEEAARRIAA